MAEKASVEEPWENQSLKLFWLPKKKSYLHISLISNNSFRLSYGTNLGILIMDEKLNKVTIKVEWERRDLETKKGCMVCLT